MQYYKKYIVTKRFKGNSICGEINLPYGTECYTVEINDTMAIVCDKGIVCYVTSQNAYDHFSQDDDGAGKKRGKLVHSILKALTKLNCNPEENPKLWKKKNEIWEKIWDDPLCAKYKRSEYEDYWLWNYDFYNAPILDLYYIVGLVGAK